MNPQYLQFSGLQQPGLQAQQLLGLGQQYGQNMGNLMPSIAQNNLSLQQILNNNNFQQ